MIVYLWVVMLLSWAMSLTSVAGFIGEMLPRPDGESGKPFKFLISSLVWFAVAVASLIFIVSGV